jgi:hypothetical protein
VKPDARLSKSFSRICCNTSNDIKGLSSIVFGSDTGHRFCSIRRQEVITMKRFLILFTLIAFVTVSCARPNKVGWTKPDYRQDQFENDRKECIQIIDQDLRSEAFGQALEECLAKKDYAFKKAEERPSGNKVTTKDIILFIALSPLILAYSVLLIGRPF